MAAFDPTKTQGTVILDHSLVVHPDTVKGSAQDVSSKFEATITLLAAFVEAAANTNPGKFKIQTSAESSGDDSWTTFVDIEIKETGTPADELTSGAEAIGQTVIEVTLTAGFVAEDLIYYRDTDGATPVTTTQALAGAELNSEWREVKSIVTDTSITLQDGITTAKDTDDELFGSAEMHVVQIPLASVGRIRVIFVHEGAAGANMHVKAFMTTHDDTSDA